MTAESHALTPAEHSPIAGLAHDAQRGISNPILGMILFITSEVMFFAGLFAAYFSTRANYHETVNGKLEQVWPPTQFTDILNPFSLIIIATMILIISSVTSRWRSGRSARTTGEGSCGTWRSPSCSGSPSS